MTAVVMSSKFQVVVPREIRERHGYRPGERLRWLDAPGGPVLVRVRSTAELDGGLSHLRDTPFEREKDYDFGETS